MKPVDYRSSGVDIQEGEKAISLMKAEVRKTFTKDVLSDLGHFGGLFRADFSNHRICGCSGYGQRANGYG